ncbi:MAG: plastocyanin/azurin family copper-binding protein [Solirubrobacteraceae bacterium]
MTKKIALALAAIAVLALLAVPALAATKSVTVGDTFFKAKSISVSKGTTVKWVWRGKLPHDVKVKTGPVKFHSTVKTKGSYSKRLTRKGTYRIICTIHPNMKQTVTVR